MPARLVLVVLALTLLGACGDPPTPTLLVTSECNYDGPRSVTEGQARLTLQRTGLGDYGAAVVRFRDETGVSDLEALLEDDTRVWENWPDWLQVRYILEIDDDSVRSQEGDTVLMDLRPDGYALVCINYSTEEAEIVAELEVISEDD